MARLYADENFDHAVVMELRRLGHDVLTAQDAGQANQGIADQDQFRFALGQGRVMLTFNRRHFIRLHGPMQPHAGLVVCTDDADKVALAGRIHQALTGCPVLAKQLLRINRPSLP